MPFEVQAYLRRAPMQPNWLFMRLRARGESLTEIKRMNLHELTETLIMYDILDILEEKRIRDAEYEASLQDWRNGG